MKRLYSFLLMMAACLSTAQAQYVVSDKYNLHFEDTGHEVTTRKSVACLIAQPLPAQCPQGYVDLGLPSGTLWKAENEAGGFYTYDQAMAKFGNALPTTEQLEELRLTCRWTWTGNGYQVEGPNGETIMLPAEGGGSCDGEVNYVGKRGYYWSPAPGTSGKAWFLFFNSREAGIYDCRRCDIQSVRIVR